MSGNKTNALRVYELEVLICDIKNNINSKGDTISREDYLEKKTINLLSVDLETLKSYQEEYKILIEK